MKKYYKWITAFLLMASIFTFGCKVDPTGLEIVIEDKGNPVLPDVTELSVSASNGNAALNWKNPVDTDFSQIQVTMLPSEGSLQEPAMLGKNITNLDVTGLTVGKEYIFVVKIADENLNFSKGAIKKVMVEENSDKTAPADVSELKVLATNGSAVLNWKNPTDTDFASVQVSMSPAEGSLINPMILGKDITSLNVTGLTVGKEYTFTVKSIDTSGNKSQGVSTIFTPTVIEKGSLNILLEPNTTERTNKDVVITVNATTTSENEIEKIAYVEGAEANVDTVLAGTDITESKKITASENTTFTVAALDSAGLKELAFITLSNIDKTAPAQVANVTPNYSRNNNAITLSWTNPADKDFAGTEIVYGKTDSEETTTLIFDKDTTSATIENIPDDDSEYTIAIKTKDDLGNLGEAKTVTVVAATGAKITSVNLDRTHLDSIMTNRDINVTISGSNFDVLSSLLVQVTDGSKAETPVTATINKETNTATATITAPVPASPTNMGTTYTVKVIADDILSETTATFVVSTPADVTSIALSETQITVGTQESVTATITGTNFDIRGVTKVKLLDSNGDEYTASTVTVPIANNTSNTEFTANIQLPTEEGTYTVAVFFDDVKDATTTTLQVIESVASYEVGDIILTDGSKVSVANVATYTIDENNKPIGVVAMITDVNGVPTPKVIGLQKSASTLKWASSDTTGYNTKFTNIVCNPSKNAASTATFTGDTEGSDNWAEICAVDPEGTADAATNYPAFNFANTYGTTAGLTGTGYESGWYVPSIAELCEVYKNKDVIQTSLTKASGFTIGTSVYWSSSQSASSNNNAYQVYFNVGYVSSDYKNFSSDVFVLQALTANITSVNLDRTHLDSIMINRDIEVTIRGNKFDCFSSLLVQVTDGITTQTQVTEIIDAANNTATATITAPVPASPTNNGTTYTVKVIADDILSETTATFVVSNPADVTSIALSETQITVGTQESVTATITGTNFDIRGVTKVKLLDSNGDEVIASTVTVPIANNTSNTEFTANIQLPTEEGTYTVAVFFDDVKDTTTTTLQVIESVTSYEVGDIILTNGSKVSVNDVATYTIDENNKPIGVVAMITDINGVPTPKVIGLQKSASTLKWTPSDTTGYTMLTNIVCTPSLTGGEVALIATFTGDTEGSDNWAEICAVDPEGTADAATNYPAFNFANTYGTTAGLTGTDYENGWYVPSIAELCEIYKNKEVIQTSLTKASGFEFGTSSYWSSSQDADSDNFAYEVGFNSGNVTSISKIYYYNVFVLQALTAE